MIQLFHNSFIDGFFSSSTVQQPRIEKMKLPEPKVKVDSFSLFSSMKKSPSVKSLNTTTPAVLKRETKTSNDMSYYPHSGMGLFFV